MARRKEGLQVFYRDDPLVERLCKLVCETIVEEAREELARKEAARRLGRQEARAAAAPAGCHGTANDPCQGHSRPFTHPVHDPWRYADDPLNGGHECPSAPPRASTRRSVAGRDEDLAPIAAGGPEAIDRRLANSTGSGTSSGRWRPTPPQCLVGLGLGKFVDRRFSLLPRGRRLPAPARRPGLVPARAGIPPPGRPHPYGDRQERYALKALRGDFREVATGGGHDPPRRAGAPGPSIESGGWRWTDHGRGGRRDDHPDLERSSGRMLHGPLICVAPGTGIPPSAHVRPPPARRRRSRPGPPPSRRPPGRLRLVQPPKIRLDGRAAMPMAKLYQPKASPLRSPPTRSATSAFSAGSVRA